MPPATVEPLAAPVAQAKVKWYKLDTKAAKRKRDEEKHAQQIETNRRSTPSTARRQPQVQFERPAGMEPPPFVRQLPPLNDPETFAARRRRVARRSLRRRAKS